MSVTRYITQQIYVYLDENGTKTPFLVSREWHLRKTIKEICIRHMTMNYEFDKISKAATDNLPR